jgi:hypothetical protein
MPTQISEKHIATYSSYVGKPLNLVDEAGNKFTPEDRREAQNTIKEAHEFVKLWAIGIRDRIFPMGTTPNKNISATNQRGNFRDYLPQTFQPTQESPTEISYWVYLWCNRESPNNDISFRISLGVNEDKADKHLKEKVQQVREKYGGQDKFTIQLPANEGIKLSIEELIAWGCERIQQFPLTYEQFRVELEPELSNNTKDIKVTEQERKLGPKYWLEKVTVKGRADRESGDNALGKSLWSPQTSKGKRQADIYSSMRRVMPGDVVFHLIDNQSIVGLSLVQDKVDDTFICLEGTQWAGELGYRIQLRDYSALPNEINRDEIFSHKAELLQILEFNSNLFYTKKLNLNQGNYLTPVPIELVKLFDQIYFNKTTIHLPYVDFSNISTLSVREQMPIYSTATALNELLISKKEFEEMLESLHSKKNLILQGPPGTGKSFVAKRLAYALLGFEDDSRIESVQFHQSFSYEDFIQGFRPKKDGTGFTLKDGVFYRFCKKALLDLTRPYVFIIDEINRGNLSKIFGEVMLLIETDKRDQRWEVSLTYSDESASKFYIPANVHILGMMNTADRSLAIVDYALRRRFAFKDVLPGFDSDKFGPLLESKGVELPVISAIQTKMAALNKEIESSVDLGRGFTIGHSFFVPFENVTDSKVWYERVIKNEIVPLLREYWFDKKQSEVDQHILSLNL